MKTLDTYIESYKDQLAIGDIKRAYKGLIEYIMSLQAHFTNKHFDTFHIGHLFTIIRTSFNLKIEWK